ncbi:hypothetical protein [Sedimentimonas flavescens]|uniref:hypothetical protein n=1 Tax=Sedimentimonas flavescens TaxID=2851012 RepID=UPI001C4A087F|nr:hypothetical protein [Sedimentimonas flavescens]
MTNKIAVAMAESAMTDGRNQKLLCSRSHVLDMSLKWPRIVLRTPVGILSWSFMTSSRERHVSFERGDQTIREASNTFRLPVFFVGFGDAGLAGGAFVCPLQLILCADVTRQTSTGTPGLRDGALGTKPVVGSVGFRGFTFSHRFASNCSATKISALSEGRKSRG